MQGTRDRNTAREIRTARSRDRAVRFVQAGALVSSRPLSAWRYLTVRLVGAGRTLAPPVVPPPPLVVPPLPPVVPPPLVVPPVPLKAASRRPKFTPGSVPSDARPL